jgi:ParB family chromosome partitioning protein
MVAPLQKSRLGRGLASLIGEPVQIGARLPVEGEHRVVAIEQVKAGRLNPRRDFAEAELSELAESIRQKGLVQPILVRADASVPGAFEIVAGERRWRAAQRAGLHQVPVIVRDLGDQEVLELAIIENVQRADLNALEEAGGYRDLIERYGYTQDKLAEVIGKSRSHVANTLRLLKLPESVQQLMLTGKISAGHGRAMVGRNDAEAIAQKVLAEDLTVRDVEALVQEEAHVEASVPRRPREKDADTRAFEKEVADLLGLRVEIKRGSGESGRLVIKYGNFDQLDYIRQRLLGGGS